MLGFWLQLNDEGSSEHDENEDSDDDKNKSKVYRPPKVAPAYYGDC